MGISRVLINRLKYNFRKPKSVRIVKTLEESEVKLQIFFYCRVFFHEHSLFTGQQGKRDAISLTPPYHFHPLHRHFDIAV